MCSVSLERHAKTLRKLAVINSSKYHFRGYLGTMLFDLRWFQFSRLSALSHLELWGLQLAGESVWQLRTLTHLDTLALENIDLLETHVEAIFPSLPRLRSVKLLNWYTEDLNVMQWLPLDLDLLDVSGSRILVFPQLEGADSSSEEMENSRYSFTAREGKRSVRTLVAHDADDLRFDHFLQIYAGTSIRELDLGFTEEGNYALDDLAHLLSRTPNVLKLRLVSTLDSYKDFDESVFSAISLLSSLCHLTVYQESFKGLALVANGPCRHSLQHILLTADMGTGAGRIESAHASLANFSCLVSERFDRCVVKCTGNDSLFKHQSV